MKQSIHLHFSRASSITDHDFTWPAHKYLTPVIVFVDLPFDEDPSALKHGSWETQYWKRIN